MAAGAAGLSSSAAPTHLDLDGRPVPSRLSDREEMAALVEEVGRAGAGSIAYLPSSAIGGLDDVDMDYLVRLGQVSGLPVIIQGLGGRNKVATIVRWTGPEGPRAVETETPTALVQQLATEFGGEVPGLTVARPTLEDIYLRMIGVAAVPAEAVSS